VQTDLIGPRSMRVMQCRDFNLPPAKTPAVHSYVALAVHTGGNMRIEHHGDFDLGAGDMHLVPAGDMHRALSARRSEMWGLAFCRTCLDPIRYRELLAPFERVRQGAAPVVKLPAARQQYVLDLLGELAREHRAGAPMPVVADSLLALVLAEVARASNTSSVVGTPSIVGEALTVIEARCLGPLTLLEVARAVKRSPAYLTTAVKQSTGRTVVEWIIEGRMAEARRRLTETDEYVDVIAERVGYADPSHFVRLFRRHHGKAPAAWRSQQRALLSG
jgi:AraC family transcriptional activator of pobA